MCAVRGARSRRACAGAAVPGRRAGSARRSSRCRRVVAPGVHPQLPRLQGGVAVAGLEHRARPRRPGRPRSVRGAGRRPHVCRLRPARGPAAAGVVLRLQPEDPGALPGLPPAHPVEQQRPVVLFLRRGGGGQPLAPHAAPGGQVELVGAVVLVRGDDVVAAAGLAGASRAQSSPEGSARAGGAASTARPGMRARRTAARAPRRRTARRAPPRPTATSRDRHPTTGCRKTPRNSGHSGDADGRCTTRHRRCDRDVIVRGCRAARPRRGACAAATSDVLPYAAQERPKTDTTAHDGRDGPVFSGMTQKESHGSEGIGGQDDYDSVSPPARLA